MEPERRREAVTAPQRVGLFGGTFDPPHCGHVAVARDVADALRLDRVLWIPVGEPPHKDPAGASPPGVRLEMTRAAAAADPRFEVSTIEIERPGPSFTVDTVRAMRGRIPDAELFVILGVDQYRELDGWRDPAGILEHARLAVMDRAGASADAVHPRATAGMEKRALEPGGLGRLPPVVFVPVRRVDVSSSDIRARLGRAGGSGEQALEAMVPAEVRAIIEREGLYA